MKLASDFLRTASLESLRTASLVSDLSLTPAKLSPDGQGEEFGRQHVRKLELCS